jgi:hypothetical protein
MPQNTFRLSHPKDSHKIPCSQIIVNFQLKILTHRKQVLILIRVDKTLRMREIY